MLDEMNADTVKLFVILVKPGFAVGGVVVVTPSIAFKNM